MPTEDLFMLLLCTIDDWLRDHPLPVKRISRVRRARFGQWRTAEGLEAGRGYCAAQGEWFFGYRLAVVAPLAAPVPLVCSLPPAAANEREEAGALLDGVRHAVVVGDKLQRFVTTYRDRIEGLFGTPQGHLPTRPPPRADAVGAAHPGRRQAGRVHAALRVAGIGAAGAVTSHIIRL